MFMNIHKGVADLAVAVKPHLTILDATKVLLDNGPKGPGTTASPGKLFAGRAAVSVDGAALSVAKVQGKDLTLDDVPHIRMASEHHGLGPCDPAKMRIRRVKA
jgi:uncharacterized protein (DUF362 family)